MRPLTAADRTALAIAACLVGVFAWMRLPWHLSQRLIIVAGITLAFALVAWLAEGVNLGGALVGYAIAFVLAASDLRLFIALLTVFMLVLAATRFGAHRKRQLPAAEVAGGRSASQVMANLGVAGLLVSVAPPSWPLLALAALAEAAADTCSSEVGAAVSGPTVLITTWERVSPGLDGGLSMFGTLAGLVAAGVIALIGSVTRLVPTRQVVIVLLAGFLGSVIDSLLGAIVERRGWITNDVVNFLSTGAAAGMAWALKSI